MITSVFEIDFGLDNILENAYHFQRTNPKGTNYYA